MSSADTPVNLSGMTMAEFKQLVKDIVQESLRELADDYDPDAGLEFRPEVAAYLEGFLRERPPTRPGEEVFKDLGLDE